MEKQRTEEDMISQLPQSLLHHILNNLTQKEAVQTCVLSKTWRHLGPTRPTIEFRPEFFNGNEEETCLSVVDKTLQRYHEQNLSVQVFIIDGMKEGPKSSSLLEKWVLQNMGVKMFLLSISLSVGGSMFRLPPQLLKAEFLTEIKLANCQINISLADDDDKVLCKNLRKLSLNMVYITDATLEKIMSSCPLIENLFMDSCKGLKTIKLTKAPNLNFFKFRRPAHLLKERHGLRSIEIIDAPSVERIHIDCCPSWIHNRNMYFPRLKSLCLHRVPLPNESFDFFSTNLPCLENLTLSACFSDSSKQFKLSSRSIKHLTIVVEGSSLKAAIIDAPNILSFVFSCKVLPSISFTTTSTQWKSKICVGSIDNGASSWFHRLSEIFKALCSSQISLHISGIPQVVPENCGDVTQPFVIENLCFVGDSFSSVPDFLNCLFRNIRPRNIQQIWYADHHPFVSRYNIEIERQLIELLCKVLLVESERAQYIGQQNLEDVKMEASNKNEEEWRGVEGTSSLSEFALPWDELKIRFRLKWRIE